MGMGKNSDFFEKRLVGVGGIGRKCVYYGDMMETDDGRCMRCDGGGLLKTL